MFVSRLDRCASLALVGLGPDEILIGRSRRSLCSIDSRLNLLFSAKYALEIAIQFLGLFGSLYRRSPRIADAITARLDLDIESPNLVEHLLRFATRHLIDIQPDADQLLIEFEQFLIRSTHHPPKSLVLLGVIHLLIVQQPNLIMAAAITRLRQNDSSLVLLVFQLLEFQRLSPFLLEFLELGLLIRLEQIDRLDVALDPLALILRTTNLVVVCLDSSNLLQDTATAVWCHRREIRHIALLDDVVTITMQASLGQNPTHLGSSGRFVANPVRGDRVVLATQPNSPGERDLIAFNSNTAKPVRLWSVGEDERRRHVAGSLATLAAIEDQLRHISSSNDLGGACPENELYGISAVGFTRAIGTGYGCESLVERNCDLTAE